MIKKIQSISEVRTNVFGEANIAGVEAPLKSGIETEVYLPHSFEFNGDWTVTHACSNCSENLQFGSTDDNFGTFVSHKKFKTLFSRFYSIPFLEGISNVLTGCKVVKSETNDWFVVTNESFGEENADILSIPKKTILSYKCPNCDAEYLCNFYIGVGYHPERGSQEGRHNMLVIDEIIQIGLDTDESFLDLEEEHLIGN